MRRIEPNRNFEPQSILRMSIREWIELHRDDPEAYRRELFDRPSRFDPAAWRRAIREWHNEIAPRGDGVFAGVPVVVKDLFDVRGEVTGCSSRLFVEEATGNRAATTDAWLVDFFRRRGAAIVGRSQMNEFAYGLDGINAYTGDCPHPLDSRRIPGGSSSGSAWSVATGIAPIALGTDTGGSIRLPAAMCGIYGYRGALTAESVVGAFPLAPSFDTTGWFTATAEDMAIVLSEFFTGVYGSYEAEKAPSVAGRAVAVLPPAVELDEEMERAWGMIVPILEDTGFSTVALRIGDERLGDRALDAYNVIGSRDAWEIHSEWMDQYREYYTPLVWSLIDRGRHWSEDRAEAARDAHAEVLALIDELFAEADCIVLPATPWKTPTRENVTGEFRAQVLRLNTIGSFGGLPALSVPIRFDAITSGGIQILCRPGEEWRFLSILPRWEGSVHHRAGPHGGGQ